MVNRKMILLMSLICLAGLFCGCDSHATKQKQLHESWKIQSALERLSEAETLLESDQLDQAAKIVDDCIKVAPENGRANLLMGKILYAKGNMVEAVSFIQTAVDFDENLHEGWYLLGILKDSDQGLGQAVELYNKALALDPSNVDYVIAIAEVYARLGNYDEAISFLRDRSDVISMSKELSIAEADIQLRRGNTKDAIDVYKSIALFDGFDREVLSALGYCYIIDGQWQQAKVVFEDLLNNCSDNEKQTYLELLAVISVNSGQYVKAVSYYDTLSIDRRSDEELWLKMGHAALGADAPKRAFACSQRALKIRGNWPDALALKGSAEYMNNDYKSAIKTFSRICNDKQLSCYAWLMTGKSLAKLGQHGKSAEAFERAKTIDPDNMLVSYLIK